MTIPANLFVDAPEMQDRALKKLDSDADTWPEEIIQQLHERIPQASSMSTMVKFKKKDEENGAATGSVVINSSDKSAVVPVIVKDFALRPLDIMIARNKILPLTPDYFNQIFMKKQAFDRIEDYPPYAEGRFEEANLWNALYPPSLGRYAYASSNNYPMLEEIAETIDGSNLMEWLKENPEHTLGFKKHGHIELIRKLAYLKPVNMNEFSQAERRLIPTDIRMLRHDGPNKYSLVSCSDQVFNPVISRVDRESAKRIVSEVSDKVEDTMNEVDQNGEKMLRVPLGGDVHLTQPDEDHVEEAKEFDHYKVKNPNGLEIEGVVVPKVIDFQQKRVDLKIFLGKTMSTIQPKIWGVRVGNSSFKPQCGRPTAGQTGTFMFKPDPSHAIATIPVTIKKVVDDLGIIKMKVIDLTGRGYNLKICPGMELQRIAQLKDDDYILPKEMHWYPMEGFGKVTDSPISYAIKEAATKLTDRPVKLAPTGFGFYSIRGLDKYARAVEWDPTMLDRPQAKFLLTCLGCSQEKIAQAFKTAQRKGVAELHNLNFIPTKNEKIASCRPKAASMIKQTKNIKRNLFKEASYIDNAQTVDAMLSLNFISPTNINKFIGKIPHFKATISYLASTLLAGRLGIKEIPEEAVSVAMEKLIEVVDGLEKLRASQEAISAGPGADAPTA